MQRVIIGAILLAAAFYAYGEYSGPGAGFKVSSSRSGSPSGFSAARSSAIGGIKSAAGAGN